MALSPPIESLNDDTTEPIEPEFVDFPHRGEINPTGQKRLVRTVCEPNLETPKNAANADRAPSRVSLDGNAEPTEPTFIKATPLTITILAPRPPADSASKPWRASAHLVRPTAQYKYRLR